MIERDICMTNLASYLSTWEEKIRQTVGDQQILLATSGGVDSSVCAALLSKAVPGQLNCVFVDHGFMRLGEGDEIEAAFADKAVRFIRINAEERFLAKLAGVSDPETKRKIIGKEFINIFEEEAKKLGNISFLAQGTISLDVIESQGQDGIPIKSHHNVGGLPDIMDFKGIVEPLAGLVKDEVRELGLMLGLPASLVYRQPFPGPGLAIRVMGEVTKAKLDVLRQVDAILRSEIDKLDTKPNQYLAVFTDTYAVGIKNGVRTYDPVIAIRAVDTVDYLHCEYTPLPHEVLKRLADRITSEIDSVSRVVYDITSKPPATLEWE